MSKHKQAEENRKRAEQARNGLAEAAAVDQEVVETTDEVVTTTSQDGSYTSEVETLPNHVQTEKQKESPSSKVDMTALRSQLSPSGVTVLETILKYMKDMQPGIPHDSQTGAKYQSSFYNALLVIFNRLDDQDFNVLYRALLDLFEEHKEGVFADEAVYRFNEWWPMSDDGRAAFRRMLNLILVTRDAKTRRKAVQDLKDWNYIFEFGFTEEAKNRVRNFYDL